MISFDSFKKEPSVVWRDTDGNIVCPGDSCPQEKCDETCPIWCQTLAKRYLRIGAHQLAIDSYKRAIGMAPDFKAAWVNLANVYGKTNNHIEANKAYKVAYAIDPYYKNALYGLIISSKNLGQFDEAIKYCNEYAEKINENEASDLLKKVHEAQNSGTIFRRKYPIDIAAKIVEYASKKKICKPHPYAPTISELLVLAKDTCIKISEALANESDKGCEPDIWLGWGAYAGMGAVCHWDMNWDNLKSKGIAETLIEPRGVCAMDEYVVDLIGIKYDSIEGTKLNTEIRVLSLWAIATFMKDVPKEYIFDVLRDVMEAMYIFGMVYEMERIGMA